MDEPTAVHAAGELHETPYRRLTMAPAGSGAARTFQVLPSHACASVTTSSVLVLSSFPTATQAAAAVHDTPDRKLLTAPGGLPACSSAQRVPFHE